MAKSRRILVTRKSKELPKQDILVTLRKAINDQLDKYLTAKNLTSSLFSKVRKYMVSHLLFFNGRRVNEVSNLKISELNSAMNDEYICDEEGEDEMIENFSIAYVAGKNPAKPVDVILDKKYFLLC